MLNSVFYHCQERNGIHLNGWLGWNISTIVKSALIGVCIRRLKPVVMILTDSHAFISQINSLGVAKSILIQEIVPMYSSLTMSDSMNMR